MTVLQLIAVLRSIPSDYEVWTDDFEFYSKLHEEDIEVHHENGRVHIDAGG